MFLSFSPHVYCLLPFSLIASVSGGVDDDITTTSTVVVLERLRVGDEVYVRVEIENDHDSSNVHSSSNRHIHFTGQRISD